MQSRVISSLILFGVALTLTVLFWWPLYCGAGFIGGDLYPYFFPQKAFYADSLKAGAFPLWNDLSGFGYPILGESQTGAAYPFHFLLYWMFDLNTAYNIEHLLHYLICFVFTWLFARRLGLSVAGAGLSALVFTYSWFPPRACLEWAVLTGAWLPVALWCVESFVQTRHWKYAIGLSLSLGLQLLAGHFHLAFITLMLVTTYGVYRLFIQHPLNSIAVSESGRIARFSILLGLGLAVIAGAGLAAVQLVPTWELKQRSTRVIRGGEYDPAYGHLPPMYLSQIVMPWKWYSLSGVHEDHLLREVAECVSPWHWFSPYRDAVDPNQAYDLDQAIQRSRFGALAVGTNKVEAHLYCGMIPICMATIMLVTLIRLWMVKKSKVPSGSLFDATFSYWVFASLFALAYATGLLMPVGKLLPGFSFFRGPGRYGIVVSLAVALFAGQAMVRLMERVSQPFLRGILLTLIFSSTCGDLWLVSRMVTYAVMVSPPRISYRNTSVVRQQLQNEVVLPRLLAPGPNVGNLLGVSCVPWYLGMAPAEYVDPQFAMPPVPKPLPNHQPTPATRELIDWLNQSGVTHILNFEPLDERSWQVQLVWQGVDPFLNSVWARQEPIFLYRFRPDLSGQSGSSFSGRSVLQDGDGIVTSVDRKAESPDLRRFQLKSQQNGKATLIDRELAYPGWTAFHNGVPIESQQQGMFRSVELSNADGEVTWVYRPQSVYVGAIISLLTLLILASIGHLRFWHPRLVDRLLRPFFPKTTGG